MINFIIDDLAPDITPNSVKCKKCGEIQTRCKHCVVCGTNIMVHFAEGSDGEYVR